MLIRRFEPDPRRDQVKEQSPKNPEMGEDLADIVAAGAEDSKDCVAEACRYLLSILIPIRAR